MTAVKRVFGLLVLVAFFSLCGFSQQSRTHLAQPHVGRVVDWTSRHLIYSGGLANADLSAGENEPRMLYRLGERNLRRPVRGHRRSRVAIDGTSRQQAQNLQYDWSFSLGNGHVAANMFPAKFGFNTSATPSCTTDYVVFGLDVPGVTGGQANIVGLNRLYSGNAPRLCNASTPTVYFSYNGSPASGSVLTSPSPSLDGTKIAYLESAASSSIFHVLTIRSG
jgi:hypothetical protein